MRKLWSAAGIPRLREDCRFYMPFAFLCATRFGVRREVNTDRRFLIVVF
jgi:hypothetical protein